MDKALLIRILDEAFYKRAWHGPNLMNSLRGVSAAEAVRRPGRERHSIWELALHAAYWKYVVRRKLLGLGRGSFERSPSNFPTVPSPPTQAAWRRDVKFLRREHELLRDAIGKAPLNPRKTRLAYGASLHDVYHAGQIRLIRVLNG